MLGATVRAMVGVPLQFLGALLDLCNKLAGPDCNLWFGKLRLMLRESINETKKRVNRYLYLLPGVEALEIPACDGTRTIAEAGDVFRSYIDSKFENYGSGEPTPARYVQVYEQVSDSTYDEMFTSLSSDLDKLVLTQAQVIAFCQKHEHLRLLRHDGYATFFLLKVNGEFFVVDVGVDSHDGLRVGVDPFGRDTVWTSSRRFRLVSPQLDA